MLTYPVSLKKDDNETLLVTFADFPEAHTWGRTREEALKRAVDALETAIIGRMSDRDDVPLPSRGGRRPSVMLPTLSGLKVMLYRAMREQGQRKAELARRLGAGQTTVDRLLDLRHATRLDQLEAALAKLGKKIEVRVRDAA